MKPEWKDAPEWANWLAQDGNGDWVWFEYEPQMGNGIWESRYGKQALHIHSWRTTKEQRPLLEG